MSETHGSHPTRSSPKDRHTSTAKYSGQVAGAPTTKPDRLFSVPIEGERGESTVAAWTQGVASWDGLETAAIDVPSTPDPLHATRALQQAVAGLRDAGFGAVIGPMQGSTWRTYRLVIDRGSRPPFFLEPWTDDSHPASFEAAGFTPTSFYFSAGVDDLSISDPRLTKVEERLLRAGVGFRSIDMQRFDDELESVYRLSIETFNRNPFYTPIERADFIELYRPLRHLIVPELVTIAERDGKPVGFLFGIPDLNQARDGGVLDTVIVKSVARSYDRAYSGLGALLIERCHHTARQLGMRRAIHALMHEENASLRISSRYGQPFRRYALYARRLQP